MNRILRTVLLVTSLLALVACGKPQPDVGASVGTGGPAAHAGVSSGRVNTGVSTHGAYASVDVVQSEKVDVTVGTGGAGASVRVGHSPLRVGIGTGGLRLGI